MDDARSLSRTKSSAAWTGCSTWEPFSGSGKPLGD